VESRCSQPSKSSSCNRPKKGVFGNQERKGRDATVLFTKRRITLALVAGEAVGHYLLYGDRSPEGGKRGESQVVPEKGKKKIIRFRWKKNLLIIKRKLPLLPEKKIVEGGDQRRGRANFISSERRETLAGGGGVLMKKKKCKDQHFSPSGSIARG